MLTCLALSIRAHPSLRVASGVFSASRYKPSTLVGFRHHVIVLLAWLSSRFSRCVYFDLDHTEAAYLATEYHTAEAVVLIRLAFVPHLAFSGFLRRLFRVSPVIFVLSMCSLYLSVLSQMITKY